MENVRGKNSFIVQHRPCSDRSVQAWNLAKLVVLIMRPNTSPSRPIFKLLLALYFSSITCSSTLSTTGVTFRVIQRNAIVVDGSRIIGSSTVASRPSCLLKCLSSNLCWGTEYSQFSGKCRLIGGSGPGDWAPLNTSAIASETRILWVHRANGENQSHLTFPGFYQPSYPDQRGDV